MPTAIIQWSWRRPSNEAFRPGRRTISLREGEDWASSEPTGSVAAGSVACGPGGSRRTTVVRATVPFAGPRTVGTGQASAGADAAGVAGRTWVSISAGDGRVGVPMVRSAAAGCLETCRSAASASRSATSSSWSSRSISRSLQATSFRTTSPGTVSAEPTSIVWSARSVMSHRWSIDRNPVPVVDRCRRTQRPDQLVEVGHYFGLGSIEGIELLAVHRPVDVRWGGIGRW